MRKMTRREVLVTGGAAVLAVGLPMRSRLMASTGPLSDKTVVAGGPDDFMTVRHLRLEGTNREIGKELARIARTNHHSKLSPVDAEAHKIRRAWFAEHFPALDERAHGVADTFGQPWDGLTVDPYSLGYDLIQSPGCSTVYYPGSRTKSGHAVLSRNYDFSTRTYAELIGQTPGPSDRAFTADPYVLELRPKDGLASLSMVSYDLLSGCIDGINEKGLSVALLADDVSQGASPATGAQAGLGEIEVPRFLLETCSSVAEVKESVKELKRYYSFIPCHYIVGDSSGQSCIVEWTIPDGKLKVTDGRSIPQIVTNHLVCQYPDSAAFPSDAWPAGSFSRYCRLESEIALHTDSLSDDDIKAINQTVQAGPLMGPPQAADDPKPGRTLWHSVYDQVDRSLEVSFYLGEAHDGRHGQRRTPYLKFKL